MIGRELGRYRLVEMIGRGGMGAVYRAHDAVLRRDVAVKVMLDGGSDSGRRFERFEREAHTVAQLSHPNILSIHDFGEHDGILYAVTELLEGEDLARRLMGLPLSVTDATGVGVAVAEGLAAAHKEGILHRDIKPHNVFLTSDGGVKILDFGLARPASREDQDSRSGTAVTDLTEEGAVLGTAAFMSPEQVRGKTIDHRSDIFSFGTLLYQMLTGTQPFQRENRIDSMSAILRDDPPPPSTLRPEVSSALDEIVLRCLRKVPGQRFQSADDLAFVLRTSFETRSSPAQLDDGGSNIGGRRPWIVAAMIALAAVAGAVAIGLWDHFTGPWDSTGSRPRMAAQSNIPTENRPLTNATLELPEAYPYSFHRSMMALSPDGRLLVYSSGRSGTLQLLARPMNHEAEVKPIPGTEGGTAPFFSPDGAWIGFFVQDRIMRVPIGGGTATLVADDAVPPGDWGPNGLIVFRDDSTHKLSLATADGESRQQLTVHGLPSSTLVAPQLLPGGAAVVVSVDGGTTGTPSHRMAAQSFGAKQAKTIELAAYQARYIPTGHLVFSHQGSLVAAPFDPVELVVTGPPVSVQSGVRTRGWSADYTWSQTGTLVYVAGDTKERLSFVRLNRSGQISLLAEMEDEGVPRYISIAPDGRDVVLSRTLGGRIDVWILDLVEGEFSRQTVDGTYNSAPVWSPDGKEIAFSSDCEGGYSIFRKAKYGSAELEKLITSELVLMPTDWSPDGDLLLYDRVGIARSRGIWLLDLRGKNVTRPLIQTGSRSARAVFSPDGDWIAYQSDESGRWEVYAQRLDNPSEKHQLSDGGGTSPRWSQGGDEVFFRNGTSLMAVNVSTDRGLEKGAPEVVYEGSFRRFDLMPDGSSFILLVETEDDALTTTRLEVVFDWFEEVMRSAPVAASSPLRLEGRWGFQ